MEGIRRDGAHCDSIRPILQEIDPLFDIEFNYDDGKYIIRFNGGVFDIKPFGTIDRAWMNHTREVYWLNRTGRIMEDVDSNNEKLERAKEKYLEDMARDLAEQMRKPLIETHYYGG